MKIYPNIPMIREHPQHVCLYLKHIVESYLN